MKKNVLKNNKGLSLAEMIIALAIIMILVGVAGVQLVKYIEKSKLSKDVSNAKAMYSDIVTTIGETQIQDEVLLATGGKTGGGYVDFTAAPGGAFAAPPGVSLASKTLNQYRPTTPAFNYNKNNPSSWVITVRNLGNFKLDAHVYIKDGTGANIEVAPTVSGPYADVE
ncbi:MAG: prepilin-type N-terminal cleavage/methylation domain-containing protein [Lachnospiraceae bacterium]|nr:prepilin-type N-terminal cleavage/methylation domain-containing protein [Lachnospiraceae bacterium]